MCDSCPRKEDSYTNSMRVVKTIDMLLSDITTPSFSKQSQHDRWADKPEDNPFISHKAITKRAKKYAKEVKAVYKKWQDRFKERYRARMSPMNFFLSEILGVKKVDFTEEDWEAILSGLIQSHELDEVFAKVFVLQELETSFDEVLNATIKEFELEVNPHSYSVPTRVVDEYKKFNLKLTKKMAENLGDKIQTIVTFGIEDGKSTRDIAKDINAKFGIYTKKEAERVARTETIRASSRGALSAYESLGVTHYELLPAKDACEICISRASEGPFKLNDTRGRPPIHPSCRCSVIPVLK